MIILVGSSGYVGTAYQSYLNAHHIPFTAVTRHTVDLGDKSAIATLLRTFKADFVINAAGYTGRPNVDATENEKTRCMISNAVLPGTLAEVCADEKIPFGHVSTGCIYSGTRPDGNPFTEEDAPNFTFRQNNCGFYCGTKALAEEILAAYPEHYIWRLRLPFNEVDNPRNYLAKVMRYAKLIDVRNSISQLDEFVRATVQCCQKRVPFGTYNVTNPGSVTTRDVVEKIQKRNLVQKKFEFFKNEAEFMSVAAKVPRANCTMDCSKLLKTGIPLTEIHDAIDWSLDHWTV